MAAAPAVAPPAPVPASAPASASLPFVFAVQARSFLLKANAERLAAELTKRGIAARVLQAQSLGEPTWQPVVLAPARDVAAMARQPQEFSARAKGARPKWPPGLLEVTA